MSRLDCIEGEHYEVRSFERRWWDLYLVREGGKDAWLGRWMSPDAAWGHVAKLERRQVAASGQEGGRLMDVHISAADASLMVLLGFARETDESPVLELTPHGEEWTTGWLRERSYSFWRKALYGANASTRKDRD